MKEIGIVLREGNGRERKGHLMLKRDKVAVVVMFGAELALLAIRATLFFHGVKSLGMDVQWN